MFLNIYNGIKLLLKIVKVIIIKPIKKVLDVCAPLLKWYKTKWIEYTYDRFGDFDKVRGAKMILYTIISFYVIISILGFTFDLGYYLYTKKTETIYLSDSVELDSDNNLWGVKGCPTKDCDSNTALYFRIRNTWFNTLWNIKTNGSIFLPDVIAAGVPTGQSKCEVTSYGLRYRILMVYNYYPQILQVKCQSLTSGVE